MCRRELQKKLSYSQCIPPLPPGTTTITHQICFWSIWCCTTTAYSNFMRETTQHFQFPVHFLVCCLTFTSVVLSLVRPSVWWKFKICSSFAHTFHSIYSAALASTSHTHTFDDSVYCCQLNCHRYNVLHRVLVHLLMPRYRSRAHRYGAGLPSSHLFTGFCHSTQWSVSKLTWRRTSIRLSLS